MRNLVRAVVRNVASLVLPGSSARNGARDVVRILAKKVARTGLLR